MSATPGPMRLWPFQKEIADAIADPTVERVSVVKGVRVGYSSLLTASIAGYVANEPAPIMVVLPAEADCRDFMVSDVEPTFAASPAVARALAEDMGEDRNTLMSRRFPGGSLKVVAARSPRNLRRHTVKVLLLDEIDGMELTAEGSPIALAEKRTLSFPDRRIVAGSTPTDEATSLIARLYDQSDQRVYECPCPECGDFHEIAWKDIRWPEGRPEEAAWACPSCGAVVDERHKGAMVAAGRWRATRSDVRGHAGFRINCLVSPHVNASWGRLAEEFLRAKDDPEELRVFANTVLAEPWRGSEGDGLDEADLAARAEPWGMEEVPAEALALTAGVDVQHDRLECTFLAWPEAGGALVLGHRVIWGQWDAPETWQELDELLTARWPHALGGRIGLDAACVDAGDGATSAAVMAFCAPRLRRRIMAIKGVSGFSRPIVERAKRAKGKLPLWLVGVDAAKVRIFSELRRRWRFSRDLEPVWFEMLCSERMQVRYSRGQPVRRFERIPGRRAEALDAVVYALAARSVLNVDWEGRRAVLAQVAPAPRRGPILESSWMKR